MLNPWIIIACGIAILAVCVKLLRANKRREVAANLKIFKVYWPRAKKLQQELQEEAEALNDAENPEHDAAQRMLHKGMRYEDFIFFSREQLIQIMKHPEPSTTKEAAENAFSINTRKEEWYEEERAKKSIPIFETPT